MSSRTRQGRPILVQCLEELVTLEFTKKQCLLQRKTEGASLFCAILTSKQRITLKFRPELQTEVVWIVIHEMLSPVLWTWLLSFIVRPYQNRYATSYTVSRPFFSPMCVTVLLLFAFHTIRTEKEEQNLRGKSSMIKTPKGRTEATLCLILKAFTSSLISYSPCLQHQMALQTF